MQNKSVAAFAEEHGFEDIEYSGKWGEYEAYKPIRVRGETLCTGLPIFILKKSGELRISTYDEAFSVIDTIFP
jgi:hypothetical protein